LIKYEIMFIIYYKLEDLMDLMNIIIETERLLLKPTAVRFTI